MNESTTTRQCSACASLAAVGVKVKELDLFGPIRERVQIGQKTVKHTPIDKLSDSFISLLAGAQGLVEINTRLRTDPELQRAFGREACAEQSVVQETLDACTAENYEWPAVWQKSGLCQQRLFCQAAQSTRKAIGLVSYFDQLDI